MRIGKNSIDTAREDMINTANEKEAKDRRGQNSILITLLPILSMIATIIPGILNRTSGVDIAKVAVITMILTTVATFYIRLNPEILFEKKLAKTVITLSYLCSICLLLMIPKPSLYCLWMIGGLLVSMVIDNKLGLLFHFSLSFIMGISISSQPEIIIHILIIGLIMNLLSSALRSTTTAIYAMIIVLSMNVTISFVINNFIFETKVSYNYLFSLFSILAVLVAAFLLSLLYELAAGKDNLTVVGPGTAEQEPVLNMQSITLGTEETEEEVASSIEMEDSSTLDRIVGTTSSYEVLCSPSNELMLKFKQYSEALYAHAHQIADLSERAAKLIGAQEQLAKAGGLYHEIGKMNGKNYIEEGLMIAEDYAFPKELKAIIKEHNIKQDKPNSVEAVIVMLSDSVVSTIEYLEKTGENKYTTNKIIDNIFQMRMEKGTFDNARLSLKDYKLLKEFYQKEYQ